MKLTLQLKLMPSPEQRAVLRDTMARFNEAATVAARAGHAAGVFSQPSIHKLAYRDIRERFGLSAQMAVRAIGKAVEAFKTLRAKGRKECPVFKPRGAVTYDERILGFKGLDKVSLWTLTGGKFFLYVTVDLPATPPGGVKDFLGVDLGIANIATDSDGNRLSGAAVERIRRKHNLQRKRLQRKGTRGAKKKLRRMAGKEARFRRHNNHVISKTLVTTAQRTGRGIALEDLKGIRERVTARGGDARNRLSGWSFGQLYAFLAYKAQLAGVPVVTVDPRNTSQTCAECGHCERANRKSQGEFSCRACGHQAHADENAARNIRARATSKLARELDGLTAEPESRPLCSCLAPY